MGIVLVAGYILNLNGLGQEPFTGFTSALAGALVPCVFTGLVHGGVVGVFQLAVLRHYLIRALLGPWVLFSAVGGIGAWLLGALAGVGAFIVVGPYGALFVGGAIAGATVGFAQSKVLQRNSPEFAWSSANSWVLANTIAGAVSLLIGGGFVGNWFGFTWSLLGESLAGWVISLAVAAALYGAITGYTLPSIMTFRLTRASSHPADSQTRE